MGRALDGKIGTRWPEEDVYEEFFQIDGSGTAALLLGGQYATLVDNDTGDYLLTFTYPGAKVLGAWAQVVGATPAHAQCKTLTKNAVNVIVTDLAGTPADADLINVRVLLAQNSREF